MTVKELREFLDTIPEYCGVFIAYPNVHGEVSYAEPHIMLEVDPQDNSPMLLTLATLEAVAMANTGLEPY